MQRDCVATTLKRHATALITWLSDEIDELTFFATGEEHRAPGHRATLH
jgi:hypothetical protein